MTSTVICFLNNVASYFIYVMNFLYVVANYWNFMQLF